jgi:hypothetical protein
MGRENYSVDSRTSTRPVNCTSITCSGRTCRSLPALCWRAPLPCHCSAAADARRTVSDAAILQVYWRAGNHQGTSRPLGVRRDRCHLPLGCNSPTQAATSRPLKRKPSPRECRRNRVPFFTPRENASAACPSVCHWTVLVTIQADAIPPRTTIVGGGRDPSSGLEAWVVTIAKPGNFAAAGAGSVRPARGHSNTYAAWNSMARSMTPPCSSSPSRRNAM